MQPNCGHCGAKLTDPHLTGCLYFWDETARRLETINELAAREVEIDYLNWRGERAWRKVRPLCVVFRVSEWHASEGRQWILEAVNVEDGKRKDFPLRHVHGWRTCDDRTGRGAKDGGTDTSGGRAEAADPRAGTITT